MQNILKYTGNVTVNIKVLPKRTQSLFLVPIICLCRLKGIGICYDKLKQWLFDVKGKTHIAPVPLHQPHNPFIEATAYVRLTANYTEFPGF